MNGLIDRKIGVNDLAGLCVCIHIRSIYQFFYQPSLGAGIGDLCGYIGAPWTLLGSKIARSSSSTAITVIEPVLDACTAPRSRMSRSVPPMIRGQDISLRINSEEESTMPYLHCYAVALDHTAVSGNQLVLNTQSATPLRDLRKPSIQADAPKRRRPGPCRYCSSTSHR